LGAYRRRHGCGEGSGGGRDRVETTGGGNESAG
jgi:hypothetical protein